MFQKGKNLLILNIDFNGLAPTLLAPTYVSIYVLSTDG